MESKIVRLILKTVLYSDIFEYPLTDQQIWKYLIASETIDREDFEKALKNIKSPVEERGGWYFISGRESLIKKRLKRKKESAKKLEIVYETVANLSKIPTVLLIGVSGGVSLHNADRNDDIDIFVIAKKNKIWITRISIIFLLSIRGKYRKRLDRSVANKICLNMLIDEQSLTFPSDRQDLYTAHEIVQMRPIFQRNKTYEKFLEQNTWVLNLMPNSLEKIQNSELRIKNKGKQVANYLVLAVEFFAKKLQLWYIKRHISRETVSDGMLAFHPVDYKKVVLREWQKRLEKYGQKI